LFKIYLDTSALIKRYLVEEGSDEVDSLFERAYKEKVVIVTSQWNVGEAAVVFDKYHQRDVISDVEEVFGLFYNEARMMTKLGSLRILPVLGETISRSILLVFAHHIYIADALQIETCKQEDCELFVTFDEKLNTVAIKEGLKIVK